MSTTLSVDGMSCTGCEYNVESAVSALPGCQSVEADHDAGTVIVEGDVDKQALREAIDDSGYDVQD